MFDLCEFELSKAWLYEGNFDDYMSIWGCLFFKLKHEWMCAFDFIIIVWYLDDYVMSIKRKSLNT